MGRICALKDCGNGRYRLERWKQKQSKLHKCSHFSDKCVCPEPFKLFTFPQDGEARRTWISLVNRKAFTDRNTVKNWAPNRESRVCSRHFVDGEPTTQNPNPSLHMGYTQTQVKKSRPPPKARQPIPGPSTAPEPVQPHISAPISDHGDYLYKCDCAPDCACKGCSQKHREILRLQQVQHAREATLHRKTKNKRTLYEKYMKNDKKTRVYTGLQSKQTFDALFSFISPVAKKMRYWVGTKNVQSTKAKRHFKRTPKKSGPGRKLSCRDELILVLMKLRLGLTNHLLADMCGIAVSTCSHIFNTWIKMLAEELKPLIFWPDKDSIRSAMPDALNAFPNLRCTLDCTEVFIGRPNTGTNFLSKAWGGRASDQHITRESGFLELIDHGDVILADRGFTVQSDLLLRHATLYIPPPSSGIEQQSRKDVTKTKNIANARIHVERAIGRMKWFTILKNVLPISLVPLIDDIMVVRAALCNLLDPLVT